MKLYWGPHTCAIGIHVLLEEIGRPYETQALDVAGGATHEASFRRINPKGKVPTLVRDDGSVLTEYGTIARWLARSAPEARLLPEDPEAEAQAGEIMDYAIGTLHGQAFARIFKPETFAPPDTVHATLGLGKDAVKRQGREMVEAALHILEAALGDRPYAAGDRFTIADTALFYAERWAPQVALALPGNLAAHLERVRARPAVRRVMAEWGEA